ncbi:gamma-glutamyltransferase family protein [Nesterenkonia pannonica]|uniref:gamma-glutamyltransferase family protein n=1 Tax=Nesterenkonia pannonica TaxID=1548602 RepID=UPI0021648166|nr:gamma-glutamyltransferase family protein [Nesterenkonia pannonica]
MGLRVHTGVRTLRALRCSEPSCTLRLKSLRIPWGPRLARSRSSSTTPIPCAPNISATRDASRRTRGAPQHAGAGCPDGGSSPAAGDTVGLSAASSDGWAVSLVQSVYHAFGSAVLEPTTGILFQNRGTAFSLDPDHPAALTPGARPPHTLMPVLAEEHGELKWVCATMGVRLSPRSTLTCC